MNELLAGINGFEVVAVVLSGLDAIAQARALRPDLLVLDQFMEDARGLEVFCEVRRWAPETRTAIVTASTSAEILGALARAGVEGLFPKSAALAEVRLGLQAVARGERVIHARILELIAHAAPVRELSPREHEVLAGIARGETNRGIAAALGISPKTVDSHRTALMRKLSAHSSAELILQAVREGLIEP